MITIFTPTYNRANTLPRTYESLLIQSNKDFEWLIVDDGSTDNTESLVKNWVRDGKITIRYYKQNNSGKYIAFNTALNLAKGEYFFTVDSDDWLPQDSLENIATVFPNLKVANCCGIIALKSYGDGNIIGKQLPDNIEYSNAYHLSLIGYGGERSLIFKTSIIKKFPFPVVENEKFVTESVVYDNVEKEHVYYILNKSLTICEYQSDGLSANVYRTMYNNPTGYKIYYKQRIDMAESFGERVGYVLRYLAFKAISQNTKYNYNGKHSLLVNLFSPLTPILKSYYIRKGKK
jgi:glycosyltransferase involved in cell wall biosynthesis